MVGTWLRGTRDRALAQRLRWALHRELYVAGLARRAGTEALSMTGAARYTEYQLWLAQAHGQLGESPDQAERITAEWSRRRATLMSSEHRNVKPD